MEDLNALLGEIEESQSQTVDASELDDLLNGLHAEDAPPSAANARRSRHEPALVSETVGDDDLDALLNDLDGVGGGVETAAPAAHAVQSTPHAHYRSAAAEAPRAEPKRYTYSSTQQPVQHTSQGFQQHQQHQHSYQRGQPAYPQHQQPQPQQPSRGAPVQYYQATQRPAHSQTPPQARRVPHVQPVHAHAPRPAGGQHVTSGDLDNLLAGLDDPLHARPPPSHVHPSTDPSYRQAAAQIPEEHIMRHQRPAHFNGAQVPSRHALRRGFDAGEETQAEAAERARASRPKGPYVPMFGGQVDDVATELNRVRTNPLGYVQLLRERVSPEYSGRVLSMFTRDGSYKGLETVSGRAGCDEAVAWLQGMPDLKPINVRFASDNGHQHPPKGQDLASFIRRYGQWSGKLHMLCQYGFDTAEGTVASFLLGDADPGRGSRQKLASPDYKKSCTMGQGPSVEDSLFQLKWTSKSLTRSSKKMEKQERVERQKIKTAIEKGNMEGARIYAENAIRNKNQALNYLRLAGRVDAVAHRVETAVRMQQITKSMAGVTKGMDSVLKSMDLEKITKLMDKFDAQFEDIDVTSKTMEDAMAGSTAMGAPMEQVDSLVAQVAEEHGLEIAGEMVGVPVDAPGGAIAGQDDVTQRLAALNGRK